MQPSAPAAVVLKGARVFVSVELVVFFGFAILAVSSILDRIRRLRSAAQASTRIRVQLLIPGSAAPSVHSCQFRDAYRQPVFDDFKLSPPNQKPVHLKRNVAAGGTNRLHDRVFAQAK